MVMYGLCIQEKKKPPSFERSAQVRMVYVYGTIRLSHRDHDSSNHGKLLTTQYIHDGSGNTPVNGMRCPFYSHNIERICIGKLGIEFWQRQKIQIIMYAITGYESISPFSIPDIIIREWQVWIHNSRQLFACLHLFLHSVCTCAWNACTQEGGVSCSCLFRLLSSLSEILIIVSHRKGNATIRQKQEKTIHFSLTCNKKSKNVQAERRA